MLNFRALIRTMLLTAVAGAVLPVAAQTGTQNGQWRYYGGDIHNTRYSPLDQISEQNASQLTVAWRWKSTNFGANQATSETTPIMIDGKLYFTAGTKRTVVSVDAATGETLWTHLVQEEGRGAVRVVNRGVAYWTDGRGNERILAATPGYQLLSLDAKTGLRDRNFGKDGLVDLWIGLDRDGKVKPGTIGLTQAPLVVGDIVVVGMASGVGVSLPTLDNTPGYIRGYDVKSGKLVWTFHTVPQKGEPGVETWGEDHRGIPSWTYTGNTGSWGTLAADPELGLVYVPTEAASGDLYGGQRPGDNLYSDTLLALDAKTGKKKWHYQLIHHDIWDWDIPTGPVLLDVTVNGRRVKAIAQVTKQAFTYVFNRETGEPLWPIEERPVPQSNVKYEKTSPTQPIPTKPAPFDYQGYSEDILINFTPELKAEAKQLMERRFVLGPIYTPPIEAGGEKEGTWQLPGAGGGANWHGAAGDPETGYLYIPSVTNSYISAVRADPSRSEMPFIGAGSMGAPNVQGLPVIKPPYGRITAIDLNTGEHAWMVPNGTPSAALQNNAKLKELGIDPKTLGGGDRSPLLVTKTLLMGGGNRLRVLNKKTGATIHEMELGGAVTGGPMTYMLNGRQFIVVAVGGGAEGHEFVALTLPPPRSAAPAKAKPGAAKPKPGNE